MKPIYKELKVWRLLHKSVVIDDYQRLSSEDIANDFFQEKYLPTNGDLLRGMGVLPTKPLEDRGASQITLSFFCI